MVEIEIPGHKVLRPEHLVMDYNGTLACDGILHKGVEQHLNALAEHLHVHILTADTFARTRSTLSGVACALSILPQKQPVF